MIPFSAPSGVPPRPLPTKCDPLAESIQIRNVVLNNRIIVSPMTTNKGIATKAGINWYGCLGHSGASVVVVESTPLCCFLPSPENPTPVYNSANLAPLASAIHSGGARAVLQLFPALRDLPPQISVLDAPSSALAALPDAYATASLVALNAGFDGVEIYGCHGYILNQISCPSANHRTDDFGRNPFLLSSLIVSAIRRACPSPDFLIFYSHSISCRIVSNAMSFAVSLLSAGVDGLILSSAGTRQDPSQYARTIKQKLREMTGRGDMIVVGSGGFGIPTLARNACQMGDVDMVCVGKAILADVEWPRKVLERREGEIIECTGCGVGCHQYLREGKQIECVHIGHEHSSPMTSP